MASRAPPSRDCLSFAGAAPGRLSLSTALSASRLGRLSACPAGSCAIPPPAKS
eukprot:gene6863-6544_t